MNLLISVDDLAASDDIRVFDCRFSLMDKTAGRSDYYISHICLLYTSPSPRDVEESRMPSSA